ncbi:MAG: leucyl aminopeptidase [Actinomycetota bacterium]
MVTLKQGSARGTKARSQLLVTGTCEGLQLDSAAAEADRAMGGALKKHLKRRGFKGRVGDSVAIPTGGAVAATDIMVVGMGPKARLGTEQVRRAAGVAARRSCDYSTVALDLAGGLEGRSQAAAEGFGLGGYAFDRYLSAAASRTSTVTICGASQPEIEAARVRAEAATWARDIVNEPPSNRGPGAFLEIARRAAGPEIKVEILEESALAKKGMNGILTVGRGSESPPRFATFTYNPKGAEGFIGLVGKGITFDSGGLSIKSGEGMQTMKMDCSGAAAVIAAVNALPQLGPGIKVVGAVAVAENMPGQGAVKPGDVIRHYGGRTSEVLNTDAEGRLVLADALAWMSEQGPDAMVDLATLTGGMVVALGQKVAGVLSTDTELAAELLRASASSGEPAWEMPLIDDYRKDLDTAVADICNISGNRWASPIIAGLFLRDFVGDTPWAHLDIAGPAWADREEHYLSKGATGFGTRLLLDWIEQRAKEVH